MASKILMICDAYESGIGHGLQRDGLDLSKTPHGDPECGDAYQIGYELGFERSKPSTNTASKESAQVAGSEQSDMGNHISVERKEDLHVIDRLSKILSGIACAFDMEEMPPKEIMNVIVDKAREKSLLIDLLTDQVAELQARSQVERVLEGWKLVPIEPTEAMIHAGEDVAPPRPYGKVYRAMIAASPLHGDKNDS